MEILIAMKYNGFSKNYILSSNLYTIHTSMFFLDALLLSRKRNVKDFSVEKINILYRSYWSQNVLYLAIMDISLVSTHKCTQRTLRDRVVWKSNPKLCIWKECTVWVHPFVLSSSVPRMKNRSYLGREVRKWLSKEYLKRSKILQSVQFGEVHSEERINK